MARPISDEELQLKKRARRRLVGAIVLVSAVAVILPMVLDSEPKPANQNVDIQIPPTDAGEFKPRSAPAAPSGGNGAISRPVAQSDSVSATPQSDPGGSVPAAPAPSAPSSPHPSGAVADSQPAVPSADRPKTITVLPEPSQADADVKTAPPVKEKAKVAAAVPPKTAVNGAYVVQVAALSDAARVKQLQKQMKGAGVKAYTEVVSTKAGEVTRVRAGPYPTREAAEKARTQLKKAGLDGRVVPR